MKASSRANVASSFTVVTGAMIDETYAVFAAWDFERSKRENLDRLREENFIGASSATWLRDVAKVLNRRFDPAGRFTHLFDPGTGRSPSRYRSVSVIAPTATEADALSTAFSLLPPQAVRDIVAARPNLQAQLVVGQGEIFVYGA